MLIMIMRLCKDGIDCGKLTSSSLLSSQALDDVLATWEFFFVHTRVTKAGAELRQTC